MATKHSKEVMIETLKREGTTRTFTWMDFRNKRNAELSNFKEILEPDWDSNSEKVFNKRQEEHKKAMLLEEEFIKFMFPDDKDPWKENYSITIIITKEE